MSAPRQDWYAGLALAASGLAFALYAAAHHEIGSLQQMGAGFFPVVLGLALSLCGILIALPAWRQRQRGALATRLALWPLLAVSAAIVFFALALHTLGLVVTSMTSTLLVTLALPQAGWRWRLVLAASLALVLWLVFVSALAIVVPLWPWSH